MADTQRLEAELHQLFGPVAVVLLEADSQVGGELPALDHQDLKLLGRFLLARRPRETTGDRGPTRRSFRLRRPNIRTFKEVHRTVPVYREAAPRPAKM